MASAGAASSVAPGKNVVEMDTRSSPGGDRESGESELACESFAHAPMSNWSALTKSAGSSVHLPAVLESEG
jgi:hypothetical protein